MANKKISQLTAAAALTGTELLPIVQDGVTVQTTAQDVADLGGGASYQIYLAKFAQTGTNNPTMIILENTMPVPLTFTRNSAGSFSSTAPVIPFGNNNDKFFSRATVNVVGGSAAKGCSCNMLFIGGGTLFSFSVSDGTSAVDGATGTIEFRFYP